MDRTKGRKRIKQESLDVETNVDGTDESIIEPSKDDVLIEVSPVAVIPNKGKSDDTVNTHQKEALFMSVFRTLGNEHKYFYRYRIDKKRLKSKEGAIINSKGALIRMFVTVENHKIMTHQEATNQEFKAIRNEIRIAQKENRPINVDVIADSEKKEKFKTALDNTKSIDLSMFPPSKKIQLTPKIVEEAYIHLQQWCEIEQMGARKYRIKKVFDRKKIID